MNTSLNFRNLAVISFIAGTLLVIGGAMAKIMYHNNIVLASGVFLEVASVILLIIWFLKKTEKLKFKH